MKYSNKKQTENKKIRYHKFSECAKELSGGSIPVTDAMLWMRKGRYQETGITIKYDQEEAVSDWARGIRLENVDLAFEPSEDGKYTNLVILGWTGAL